MKTVNYRNFEIVSTGRGGCFIGNYRRTIKLKLWQFYLLLGTIWMAPVPADGLVTWKENLIIGAVFYIVSCYFLLRGGNE